MAIPPACIGDDNMKPRQFGSSSTLVRAPGKVFGFLGLALTATLLQPMSAFAAAPKILVVSKDVNCWPQVSGPLYPTIQSAINAMPVYLNGQNTIIVCPGTYPEQVVVNKNITITGALRDGTDPLSENGNSAEAKIVVPPGGLQRRQLLSGKWVAAQVVADNIADVNLINLTIDGHGAGCPVDPSLQPIPFAGVVFSKVGVAGTGLEGNVSKSSIRAEIGFQPDGVTHCYQGDGIIVDDNSYVTIDSNSIHDVDLSPILQTGGITRITNNTLSRTWYGIWLTGVGATFNPANVGSTVAGNYIQSSTGAGVHLDGSSNVLVSQNQITNAFGAGIQVSHGGSDNDIVENRINDAWWGIYLGDNGHRRINVSYNTIVHSTTAAIVDYFSEGDNNITDNTINDAPIGIQVHVIHNDVYLPNTFYNVTVLTLAVP